VLTKPSYINISVQFCRGDGVPNSSRIPPGLLNRRVGFPATGSGSAPGPPNGGPPLSSQLHDAGARPPPDALAPPPPPLAVAAPPLHDAGAHSPPPLHDAGARPPSDGICPPPPMLLSGAGGKNFCVFLLPCQKDVVQWRNRFKGAQV
jgi:hypothetical protein